MTPRRIACALAGVLAVAACSRGETLGAAEAVEVLVLDGVERARAVCVVETLDGSLELAKVTGLDTDLDTDDVALLAAATTGCLPAVSGGGGVIGGSVRHGGPIAAWADPLGHGGFGVERYVEELVAGGLDADVGACLLDGLLRTPNPDAVIVDDQRIVTMMVDCASARTPGPQPATGPG